MVIKLFKKINSKGCNPLERQFVRNFKSGMCLFIGTGLVVSGIFFYIWPRASLVTLIYDYNKLEQKEKKITHYNKMLRLELASIKSLEKVERIAIEKMGMIVPEDKNIILVKAIK